MIPFLKQEQNQLKLRYENLRNVVCRELGQLKFIEPIFLTQYNNILKNWLKNLKKKIFTTFSFSRNINESIHRFLKNAVCTRQLNVNYNIITQSCLAQCGSEIRFTKIRKHF